MRLHSINLQQLLPQLDMSGLDTCFTEQDILNAMNALWSLDVRSFHLLNDALMILLRKNPAPNRLKDFRLISLTHSFSKLFAKCLATRLAPKLKDIVAMNQSAFIKGRAIHDNFRSV